MVKYWDEQIEKGIKLTKFRIKHYEKHGRGLLVIEEKAKLKKQERNRDLRKEDK